MFSVSPVEAGGGQGGNIGVGVSRLLVYSSVFFLSTEWKGGGSERECWGGIVTVISIQLCVFFCQPSESRMV